MDQRPRDPPVPVSRPEKAGGSPNAPGESTPATPDYGELALVMGGGGARGAYQVGLLRYLARRFPTIRLPILTGVSAGAVNTAHLANHRGTFAEAVDDLDRLWRSLSQTACSGSMPPRSREAV